MGEEAIKKVGVKWSNVQDPNEFEYRFNLSIFKDPLAPPRQKSKKKMYFNFKLLRW